jgi:mono/diheme cytochrome c family protein
MRKSFAWILLLLAGAAGGCRQGDEAKVAQKAETPVPVARPAEPGKPGAASPGASDSPGGTAVPTATGAGSGAAVPLPFVLPVPDLGYNAREGRALYRHYCLTCHGEEGHGDGFNAYNLDPKPRDLGNPAFQSKKADDDLAAVIRSGGGVAGLSTGMPPWGRTLGERKIRNVVDYLRTLPPPSK